MMTRSASGILLTGFLLLTAACAGDVKNMRVTEANKTTVFDEIKNSKSLTVEEVGLLQAFVLRKGFGGALAGEPTALPVGLTIGQMIEDQRQWVIEDNRRKADAEERIAQARTAEAQQRKALLDAMKLTVVEKGFQRTKDQEFITIDVMYENKSGKVIRGFTGAIQFKDLFGTEITPFTINEDEPLAAGATRHQGWSLKYNQLADKHMELRNTALYDMKVEWQPQTIVFADGTTLEMKSGS
jgi:hypothetical protein